MAFRVLNLESGRSMVSGFQWGSDDLHPLSVNNIGEVGTDKFGIRVNGLIKFRGVSALGEPIPIGSTFVAAALQTKAFATNASALSVVFHLLKRDGTWDKSNTNGVWRAIDQSRLDDEIDISFQVHGLLGNFGNGIPAPTAGVLNLSFGGTDSEISQYGQSILRPPGSLGTVVICEIRMNISAAGSAGSLVMDIYSTRSPNGSDHRPGTLIATSDVRAASTIVTGIHGDSEDFLFTAEPWTMDVGDYIVGVVRVTSPLSPGVFLNLVSADDPTFGGPFSYADGNLSRFENGDGWSSKNYHLNEELPLQRLSSGFPHVPGSAFATEIGALLAPDFASVGIFYSWVNLAPSLLTALTRHVARSDYIPGDPIGMILSTTEIVTGVSNNREWDGARLIVDWVPPTLGKVEFDGIIEEAVMMDTNIEKAIIVETQIEPAVRFESRIEPAVCMATKIEPAVSMSVGIC